MNMIEKQLNAILSKEADVAAEIVQLFDNLSTDETISLSSQMQSELKNRFAMNALEEEVWDGVLSIMTPNEISEEVLDYLIQNKISLLTLCHMQLPDKWLFKLLSYDDAPLYTLAKRYLVSDKYSTLDFLHFYNCHLRNRHDVSLQLLDVYSKADKRELLLFLCSNNNEFEYKEMLRWHLVATQVRALTDSKEIERIYKAYQDVGAVLVAIAANYFTSEEILLELLSAKGVTYAKEIRKKSENTLKIKRNTNTGDGSVC